MNKPKYLPGMRVNFVNDGDVRIGVIQSYTTFSHKDTIEYEVCSQGSLFALPEDDLYPLSELQNQIRKMDKENDKTVLPSKQSETRVDYYQLPNGVQAWDVVRYLDFNCGAAVKYCTRAGRKHELGMTDKEKQIQDLNKAMDHIKDEIINVLGGKCKYELKAD